MHWLVRAARWVRNPPSAGQVKIVVVVIVLVIAIGALDHYGLIPEWAHQERMRPVTPRP